MPSDSDFIRVIRIKSANGAEKMLEIPAKLDLERPKRPRTVFSDEQLEKLEKAFTDCGYLSGVTRARLAASLGLSDNQVKVWFQNRRTKQKKMDAKEPRKPTELLTRKEIRLPATKEFENYYRQLWGTNFLEEGIPS